MRHAFLLLAVSSLSAAALAAQQRDRQPDSIPTELAVALMSSEYGGHSGGGVPLFTVGRAPERFPATLVPPGPARVVGGTWDGASGAIIVTYPTREPVAVLRAREALIAAGWKPPEPSDEGGFVVTSIFAGNDLLCRDDQAVMLQPAHPPGASAARITFREGAGSLCSHRRRMMRGPFRAALRLPALRPPAGAMAAGSGSSTGDDRIETSTRLTAAQSAAELLAHYGAQLEAAGWKGGSPAHAAEAAVQPFSAVDSTGAEWRGAIVAISAAGAEREVSLRMSRPQR
ncbi:MAG TPA: hypothetical protein VEA99_12140 [Gemmatimonadaceae bacterium]|nr:hypothetical protein [Gemmatimonadaceae bacterium]